MLAEVQPSVAIMVACAILWVCGLVLLGAPDLVSRLSVVGRWSRITQVLVAVIFINISGWTAMLIAVREDGLTLETLLKVTTIPGHTILFLLGVAVIATRRSTLSRLPIIGRWSRGRQVVLGAAMMALAAFGIAMTLLVQ